MSPNAISVIWSSWNWQDYYCGGGYSTGITKTIAIFREEVTSTLTGFHEGRLSRWNWNLEMLVFLEGFSAENLEKKNPRSNTRTNNKLFSHMAPGRTRTQATLVGGEQSQYCVIPQCPMRRENGEFSR